jgi:hypothetical protein
MRHRKNLNRGTVAVLARAVIAPAAQADLFVAHVGNGTISEVTPSGSVRTFATGFGGRAGLAVPPVPVPSGLLLAMVGALGVAGSGWRRRNRATA